MHTVTTVMFTPEELGTLTRVSSFVCLSANNEQHRADMQRRWNGVCQRNDTIGRAQLTEAQAIVNAAIEQCTAESHLSFWEHEHFAGGGTKENFPKQMADYLVAIRAAMIPDLVAAEALLRAALVIATDKPTGEDY